MRYRNQFERYRDWIRVPIEFIIKQIEVANPSKKTTAMHCPKANKKALDEGLVILAERAGFEPAVGLTLRTLSRRVT